MINGAQVLMSSKARQLFKKRKEQPKVQSSSLPFTKHEENRKTGLQPKAFPVPTDTQEQLKTAES